MIIYVYNIKTGKLHPLYKSIFKNMCNFKLFDFPIFTISDLIKYQNLLINLVRISTNNGHVN
jgi:hypothetical protein